MSKQYYYTNCQVKDAFIYGFLVLRVPTTFNFGPKFGVETRISKIFFIHRRNMETWEDTYYFIDDNDGKDLKDYDIDEYNDFYIDDNELILAIFADNDGKHDRVLARFSKTQAAAYNNPKMLKNRVSQFNEETQLYYDLGDIIFSNGYMSYRTSPEFAAINSSKPLALSIFKSENRILSLDLSEFDFKASIRDFIVEDTVAHILVLDGIKLNYFTYHLKDHNCTLEKSIINEKN